jgi:alkylhydroperoxidase family enzyme
MKQISLVQTVSPEAATGPVAAVYSQMSQAMGRVPHAVQLLSASPELLQQTAAQLGYYMSHPTLSFSLLAFIRLAVSTRMECAYCIGMNESMLMNRAGFTLEQVMAAKRDPALAPLPPKELAMLLFVVKGTSVPKSVAPADLEALRALGWSDREIVEALFHGARNVASDILFDALKIENDF